MMLFKNGTLLYRATRDGFNAAAFHSKCDGRPNTVTLIKTNTNHVFGGFASAAWNSYCNYIADSKAFIFSLRRASTSKSEKFMIKPENSNKALIGNRNYGPIFGGGNDYAIDKNCYRNDYQSNCNYGSDKCNYDYITRNHCESGCDIFIKDNSNYTSGNESNIGGSYELPIHLAGSKNNWLTTEIEVYELKE